MAPVSAPADARPDEEIRDTVDQLFAIRVWDTGECGRCGETVSGIFGPSFYDKFYCRGCWIDYFRTARESDWKEWQSWRPAPRKCPCESAFQHELKLVLLGIARTGGSVTFPQSLNSRDRFMIHEFCRTEPELALVATKSYGEGDDRYLRATKLTTARGIADAEAFLEDEGVAPRGRLAAALAEAQRRAEEAERTCNELRGKLDRAQRQLEHARGRRLEELPFAKLMDLHRQLTDALRGVGKELERHSVKQAGHVWQWQTHDGTFESFEADAMLEIEEHIARHDAGAAGMLRVSNRGKPILIDFDAMEQQVLDGSGRRRKMRCADAMLLREPSWTHQTGPTDLVDVVPGTSDYARVLSLAFGGDALGADFEPVRIQRVQNKFLLRRFEAERQNMIVQRGAANLNERNLFHGTGGTDPRKIAEQREGFMLDYAKNGLYGKALYYAEQPQYSHFYAHMGESFGGVQRYQMLLCRVLCGRSRQMGASTDRALTRAALPAETYDSVLGRPRGQGSVMYVIYQEAQAYPDFLVTYRPKTPSDEPLVVPVAAA